MNEDEADRERWEDDGGANFARRYDVIFNYF